MATTTAPVRYEDSEVQKAHTDLYQDSSKRPLYPVLPPGLSQSEFDEAINELVSVLGNKNVFAGEALQDYIDPYEIDEPGVERKIPGAAVTPPTTEALQDILRVANKHGIPLWTFSRGKNIGYGGPAPALPGSIALDLHRMDKVIEVNEKFAYAVVEPGVTFTDLYNYCVDKGLKVWPSVPSLGWGSVIGNTLDRGAGFTPTASHYEHIAGLEVVLANGDTVRTGQWAQSNSPSAHLSKFSFGPSVEGLFLQSNMGVVTKMGIWLTPQPQAYMSCSFDMPNAEDVGAICDVFGDMRRSGILPNIAYVFNIIEWSAIVGKRCELYDKEGPMPESRIKELQEQIGVGHWSVKFSLYGPRAICQAQYDEVQKIVAAQAPTGRLKGTMFSGEGDRLLDPSSVQMPHGGMFVGVPSLWSLPLTKYMLPKDESGAGAHGAYSAIIPLDGKVMNEWYDCVREVYAAEGLDAMTDFFMHHRHAVMVCMLCFDKMDQKQCEAVERIFHKLYVEGKKRGFSKYRAHVNHMGRFGLSSMVRTATDSWTDMVSQQNDWNDHAYMRFLETIKDSLDPNGVLSPGKMGVWPTKYRHMRDSKQNGHATNGTNGDA
ncbi:uncharacterized protein LTR77_002228 [Saxophila tyrrhenica]|uniref:FAD-binding PCMH-type domain-containing protein n=1 Tax=Saxophila tyrrhenica TaxID=1690608 RepID=A0AAV9PKQ1_9PEZI|nr:hypothetical protein LTR77_002228 [Saxophila tyrrhenica]